MKLLTLKLVLTVIFYVKVTDAEVRTLMHRRLGYHPPFELYTSEYLIHPGQIDLSEIRIIQLPDHPTWKQIKETSFASVKILFFKQPDTCKKAKSSCDWTEIGIGIKDSGGNIHYCCDEEEINLGLCQQERNGTLIIDQSLYHGEIRSAFQSNKFYEQASIESPILSTYAGTGTYNLLLSDCNKNDSNLSFFKKYVWKSKDGNLPGYLFFEWLMFMIWYLTHMVNNRNDITSVNKWIFSSIMLGLVATTLKCIDYKEWNATGVRMNGFTYTWAIIGASNRAFILCLLLMICRGWGLNNAFIVDIRTKARMISLAILYSMISFFNEVEQQIYDLLMFYDCIYWIFLPPIRYFSLLFNHEIGKLVITITFYILSLYALNNIIRNIRTERQRLNVCRYQTLRLIVLVSSLLGIGLSIYEMINETAKTKFVIEENYLFPLSSTLDFSFVSISILWTINYTFVIVSIAIFWKPDQRAQLWNFLLLMVVEMMT